MSGSLPRALRGRSVELPRVISVSHAQRLGMSRSALEHARKRFGWQLLTRGILLTAPGEPTRTDWINVGLELAGPVSAISGWDAVRIVGLGEQRPPCAEVLILTRTGRNRLIGGVRLRLTARPFRSWPLPADHPELAFAPVVHTARAVADTALQYTRLAPVRALVTSAVQKRRCEVEEVIAEVDNGPRNHSALLRRAVVDLRNGARSVAEAEAIDMLRSSAVPIFDANVLIITVSGRTLARVDVLWRELRAVLEIDSRQFHFTEEDWNKTRARHNLLTTSGLALEHHSPREITSGGHEWATQIERWLRGRAAELGVPYVVPRVRPDADIHPPPFIVPDLAQFGP